MLNVRYKPTEDYVYCGRGSKWGNPFIIGKERQFYVTALDSSGGTYNRWETRKIDREIAIELYKLYIDKKIINKECAPQNCHCDYLLEISNS